MSRLDCLSHIRYQHHVQLTLGTNYDLLINDSFIIGHAHQRKLRVATLVIYIELYKDE